MFLLALSRMRIIYVYVNRVIIFIFVVNNRRNLLSLGKQFASIGPDSGSAKKVVESGSRIGDLVYNWLIEESLLSTNQVQFHNKDGPQQILPNKKSWTPAVVSDAGERKKNFLPAKFGSQAASFFIFYLFTYLKWPFTAAEFDYWQLDLITCHQNHTIGDQI